MKNHLIWHEWMCHTNFSFLMGASHPHEYIDQAIEYNYQSLAITDYDGVYGLARAYRAIKTLRKKGEDPRLRLHYGTEIHLSPDHDHPLVLQNTLVLLALSKQGYAQLCEIISFAHRNSKDKAFLSLQELCQFPVTDLVALVPMRGLIRHDNQQSLFQQQLLTLQELFSDRLFLTISKHYSPAEDVWIPKTMEIAIKFNIKMIFSQDAFFHHPSRKPMSDTLQAIRHNQTLQESIPHFFVNSRRSLHDLRFLKKTYNPLPYSRNIFNNSIALSEQFHFELNELKYAYPREFIPKEYTPHEYLEHLVWKKAKAFYGDILPEKISNILNHELQLIQQLDFADYFLTVHDIVHWARSQDILCQGRGSAANSAVCFVLGITAINPNHFELLFERFISAERGDPPDIDVDFEHERREEVIQYIYQRYGRARAAMVCNVITYRSKGAIRDVGKALGFSEKYLSVASDILGSRSFRRGGLSHVVDTVRIHFQDDVTLPPPPLWGLWPTLAQLLKGFPRHLGIHSGGFILSDHPISQLCPQEPATMENRTVIQWCKEDIEALGFFKVDFLSLGMLTAIRKCFDLLKKHQDVTLTLQTIPPDDPATYEMIQKADTVGVFQIESRAQMSFLPKHKPRNFYDLVVEVAIIRPGPIQGGMIHPYLRRRNGLEPVTFPDPRLKPILNRTFGVPIFQEQVMRIAIAVGNFTPGEADELRKNIGAFTLKETPIDWLSKLAEGMRQNGLQEEFIQSILNQIKGFASYGFPESHSASFAILAYASSYLKCHYPAAFFASVLNSHPMGFYSADVLLKSAQKCGAPLLPMCILKSNWDYSLERLPHGTLAIRLGFRAANGICKKNLQNLLSQRNNTYANLFEFLQTHRLSKVDLTALAATNALQCFGYERRTALWLAEAAPFSELVYETDDLTTHNLPLETELERVQLDYASTSTSLGSHPTLLMRKHSWLFEFATSQLSPSSAIQNCRHGIEIKVFGMITCRQAPPTAKGMLFVTLFDEFGSFNLVIQPHTYIQYRSLIDKQAFLCVRVKVQAQDDARSLLVKHVYAPLDQSGKVLPFKKDHLDTHLLTEEFSSSRNYM